MSGKENRVIRLRPYTYLHVLNNNSNLVHVECGPQTFIRKDNQDIVLPPTPMVNIPPRSYCSIGNPHCRDADGKPIVANEQVKLRHGDTEVRVATDWPNPFPLYPGEVMEQPVTTLTVVAPNTALKLFAKRDFSDDSGDNVVERSAGSTWLFHGPATYLPRVEVTVQQTVMAETIKPNQALKLKARRNFVDRDGVDRVAGEVWLVKSQGAYLADIEEEVVGMVRARVLTEKRALHLRASHSFTDVYGKKRKAGEEWLVTLDDSQTHLPDVHEVVVSEEVHITTLTKQQYCVVLNAVVDGVIKWGKRELRKGEATFFLQPQEALENGIQSVELLGEEEALLLRATEQYVDVDDTSDDASGNDSKQQASKPRTRFPGEEWMIYGPRKYVPPVQVQILERRRKIPLDENEGIYVRNKQTGTVTTVKGTTYMLNANEVLWNKPLSDEIEALLQQTTYRGVDGHSLQPQKQKRVPYKVVTYRVPHNAAVQIYDYKSNVSRVVFGPELVMLEPDEQFTVISLSGGNPKRANAITSLNLQLGPDFMNDIVVVETSDHARLRLKLSYNWAFDVSKNSPVADHSKIFSVRDFIGDTCKAVASRVRGAVAGQTFDNFHKNSTQIITHAVFGQGDDGAESSGVGDGDQRLLFSANLLTLTNVDIQTVEPVEQRTRNALQKSVQLAIEIATSSQEALANHEAMREEQVAEGKLQRQRIKDQADSEVERKQLIELRAKTAAVESTGQAKAEAIARSEAALIKGRAAVKQAELKAKASRIRSEARLAQLKLQQSQEIEYRKANDELEVSRARREAEIEATKFKNIVDAIGSETIEAIALAGPEMQAKLLEGLGLQGFLVTDGKSPVNLFNTANGLTGGSDVSGQ